MVSTASLFGARQLVKAVENKPASSLIVSLGEELNGTPPPLYGRRMAQMPGMTSRSQWQTTAVTCHEYFMNSVHEHKSPGVDINSTDKTNHSGTTSVNCNTATLAS